MIPIIFALDSVTTFTNDLSAENLSFGGGDSIVRNIKIHVDAQIEVGSFDIEELANYTIFNYTEPYNSSGDISVNCPIDISSICNDTQEVNNWIINAYRSHGTNSLGGGTATVNDTREIELNAKGGCFDIGESSLQSYPSELWGINLTKNTRLIATNIISVVAEVSPESRQYNYFQIDFINSSDNIFYTGRVFPSFFSNCTFQGCGLESAIHNNIVKNGTSAYWEGTINRTLLSLLNESEISNSSVLGNTSAIRLVVRAFTSVEKFKPCSHNSADLSFDNIYIEHNNQTVNQSLEVGYEDAGREWVNSKTLREKTSVNISDELQTILDNDCTCGEPGDFDCVLSGNDKNCTISLTLYSGTMGTLEITNINVTYEIPPLLKNVTTSPIPVLYGSNFSMILNYSYGNIRNISEVNATLTDPNSGVVAKTATQDEELWTTGKYIINVSGSYAYSYNTTDTSNNKTSGNYSFTINDTRSASPGLYMQSVVAGSNFTIEIDIDTNNDNLTWEAIMGNSPGSNFTINSGTVNYTFFNNVSINISMHINATNTDGVYNGSINLTRQIDGTLVEINMSITSVAETGNIVVNDPSSIGISMNTGTSSTRKILLNNTGNYNLSNISCTLDGTYSGFTFFSLSNISVIEPNSSANTTLALSSVPAGTFTDKLQCTAIANSLGTTDTLQESNRPRITLQVTTPGKAGSGGGGGGSTTIIQSDCKIQLFNPSEDSPIVIVGGLNEFSLSSSFNTKNIGEGSGEFFYSVTENDFLTENCELKILSSEIKPNLAIENQISCLISESPQTGKILVEACGESRFYDIQTRQNLLLAFLKPLFLGENVVLFGQSVNPLFILLGFIGFVFVIFIIIKLIFGK